MDRGHISRVLMYICLMSVLFPYFSNVRVVSALDDTESSGEVDGLGFSGLGDASTEAEEETFITTERPGDDRSFASIHQGEISNYTVDEVVTETQSLIDENDDITGLDVVDIAIIVEKATQVPVISKKTGERLLAIIHTMAGLSSSVLEVANEIANVSLNRLIQSVEQIGQRVQLDNSSLRLITPTSAMEVWDLTRLGRHDITVGLQVTVDPSKPSARTQSEDMVSLFQSRKPMHSKTDTAIVLPADFVRGLVDNNRDREVRLWMTVFSDISLFHHNNHNDVTPSTTGDKEDPHQKRCRPQLNSKVISASISVDGVPITEFPDGQGVTSVFLPLQKLPEAERAHRSECVFWDVSKAVGQGGWSGEGCQYHKTLEGRDVCVCDHLTNFAVLLDFYGSSRQPSAEHQSALSAITIVGLSMSIIGLSCTVISFICIRKLHSARPKQVIFNLAVAMLLSWIVFLAGFTRVQGDQDQDQHQDQKDQDHQCEGAGPDHHEEVRHAGCLAVAALLHYLLLSTFLWMLVEGVLQYLMLIKVHGNHFNRFLLKAALLAWGVPPVPVIVILAIDVNLYNGYENYCWMSLTPFYYAFLLPVGLVVLTNVIIYVAVVVSICRLRGRSDARSRITSIRASIACFIVLGLSWVLAFFAVDDARLVFQYLFTASTTLQGLFIFLVFTARDPVVRAFWGNKMRRAVACCRQGPSRSMSLTKGGSRRTDPEGEDTPAGGEGRFGGNCSTKKETISLSDADLTKPTSTISGSMKKEAIPLNEYSSSKSALDISSSTKNDAVPLNDASSSTPANGNDSSMKNGVVPPSDVPSVDNDHSNNEKNEMILRAESSPKPVNDTGRRSKEVAPLNDSSSPKPANDNGGTHSDPSCLGDLPAAQQLGDTNDTTSPPDSPPSKPAIDADDDTLNGPTPTTDSPRCSQPVGNIGNCEEMEEIPLND